MNALPRTAVIGVDSPIGLTVLRELGEHGVPLVAMGRKPRALGRYSRHAHDFHVIPKGPMAEWLPGFVAAHGIKVVMAISEGDLVQLAQLKYSIPGCTLLVPDADRLALILDKGRTLAAARAAGIDTPESWQPEAGDDLAALAADLAFPVAIKWSDPPAITPLLDAHGLDFEKIEYAANAAQLLAILHRYDALGQWPLVQTWCPGYGFAQILNMHEGRATLRFQHRRLREWPPSGGVSTFCAAIAPDEHQAQMPRSEALLAHIGWRGPAMVEYRHDPATGKYWLMEINGRFWGSMPLAYHAGAHFAWEAYRTAILGQHAGAATPIAAVRARYVIADVKHFAKVVFTNCNQLSWMQRLRFGAAFAAQFLDPRVHYYIWSIKDPMPFFGDLLHIIRKVLRLDRP